MADLPILSPLTVPEPTSASHPASKNYVDAARLMPFFMPSDHGFLSWSVDPAVATSSTAPAAGVQNLIAIKIAAATSISGIVIHTATAGATLTNSYLSLYDSSGTRLVVSADVSSTIVSAGVKIISVASTAVAAGLFYAGVLIGSAGTMPAFARASTSTVTNAGMASPPFRSCTSGSGLNTAPTSIILSSATASNTEYFVAVK